MQRPANDGRIPGEAAPPPAVADHHHPRLAGAVVGRCQNAAERRVDSERLEVAAADQLHGRVGGVVAQPVGGERLLVNGHRRERPGAVGGILQVGERGDAERGDVAGPEDAHQAAGVRHRERPQQQAVGDGEHRAGAADAHGERRDGGERQDGPRRKDADGMDHVAQEVGHGAGISKRFATGRPEN